MNPSADPSAALGGNDSARVREPSGAWHSAGGLAAFWSVAAIGPFVLCVAWVWYGFAFFEEMTEQGKAVAASNTMAGLGLMVGGIPLIVAHLIVLWPLLVLGANYYSRRGVGILLAVVAVAVASAAGIAVGELVWTGNLFAMSAAHADTFVIPP